MRCQCFDEKRFYLQLADTRFSPPFPYGKTGPLGPVSRSGIVFEALLHKSVDINYFFFFTIKIPIAMIKIGITKIEIIRVLPPVMIVSNNNCLSNITIPHFHSIESVISL